MIGLLRCAKAVASSGTREKAPPRTRICAIFIGASQRSSASSMLAASLMPKLSTKRERIETIGLDVGRRVHGVHARIGRRADQVGDRRRERAERRQRCLGRRRRRPQ